MAPATVSFLKIVGTVSVGLLTGLSYSLSTLTIPTLLGFSNAASAARAYSSLTASSLFQTRLLTGISASAFTLAYLLSPRSEKHPYLLWSSLFVGGSLASEYVWPQITGRATPVITSVTKKTTQKKGKSPRPPMDASYEVLSHDSEGTGESDQEVEVEEVNGEQVRGSMEAFVSSQIVRTSVAGLGFVMCMIGIWGDGVYEVTAMYY